MTIQTSSSSLFGSYSGMKVTPALGSGGRASSSLLSVENNRSRYFSAETSVASQSMLISLDKNLKESKTSFQRTTVTPQGDPDLLIQEYFRSSPRRRAKSRKIVAKHVNLPSSIFIILAFGRRGDVFDSYDAAIDLLAECSDISLLTLTSNLLNSSFKDSHLPGVADMLEILIKGIAFAYHIDPNLRFDALKPLISGTQSRIIKVTIIDALIALADELDTELIEQFIRDFTSDNNKSDTYVQNYAKESLQEFF